MKKEIIIKWDEGFSNGEVKLPETETSTAEIIGVLEMCKLILFENKQQKEEHK